MDEIAFRTIIARYVPEAAVEGCLQLIKQYKVHLKIVNERQTRHGDYRRQPGGQHLITVNAGTNKYRFLMTLIHEIAHLVAFEKFGQHIKPHGVEWKYTFQQLMLPYVHPDVFPKELVPLLARHFKNPKASSDADATLALAMKQYDPPNDFHFVFELPFGALFQFQNGRIFKKMAQRQKRFECIELSSQKTYLFQPNAEVIWLQQNNKNGII